jgi:hypothetical protein
MTQIIRGICSNIILHLLKFKTFFTLTIALMHCGISIPRVHCSVITLMASSSGKETTVGPVWNQCVQDINVMLRQSFKILHADMNKCGVKDTGLLQLVSIGKSYTSATNSMRSCVLAKPSCLSTDRCFLDLLWLFNCDCTLFQTLYNRQVCPTTLGTLLQ